MLEHLIVLYARCVPRLTHRPTLIPTVEPTLLCSMSVTHTYMTIFGRSVIDIVVVVARPTFTFTFPWPFRYPQPVKMSISIASPHQDYQGLE